MPVNLYQAIACSLGLIGILGITLHTVVRFRKYEWFLRLMEEPITMNMCIKILINWLIPVIPICVFMDIVFTSDNIYYYILSVAWIIFGLVWYTSKQNKMLPREPFEYPINNKKGK